MNGKLFLAFAIIPMVFLAGCGGEAPYVPAISFQISQNSIDVKDSQTSGIVTITIMKLDDKQIPTTFTVKLSSSNQDYIYPIAVTGSSQPITEQTTKTLIDKGASDTIQFKVYGKLPEGFSDATGTITARAYYNNSAVENPLTLSVKVTK